VAIFILAFYFWQKGLMALRTETPNAPEVTSLIVPTASGWYFLLAGVTCFTAYTFKSLFLFLLPTPFATLLICVLLQWQDAAWRRKYLAAVGFLGVGTFAAFMVWFVTFYVQ
jgi:hypothetical protein